MFVVTVGLFVVSFGLGTVRSERVTYCNVICIVGAVWRGISALCYMT